MSKKGEFEISTSSLTWVLKKKKKGKSRERPHDGVLSVCLSDELQHPDWRVCAHNTNRAGPYSHMSKCLTAIYHHVSSPFSREKLQQSPPKRSVQAGRATTSHCVPPPLSTQCCCCCCCCCHPRKQQTSTWEQSREPSLLLPLRPGG